MRLFCSFPTFRKFQAVEQIQLQHFPHWSEITDTTKSIQKYFEVKIFAVVLYESLQSYNILNLIAVTCFEVSHCPTVWKLRRWRRQHRNRHLVHTTTFLINSRNLRRLWRFCLMASSSDMPDRSTTSCCLSARSPQSSMEQRCLSCSYFLAT